MLIIYCTPVQTVDCRPVLCMHWFCVCVTIKWKFCKFCMKLWKNKVCMFLTKVWKLKVLIQLGGGGYNIIRSLSSDKDQNNPVCDIIT